MKSRPKNDFQLIITSVSNTVSFGKYRGQKVSQVLENDPSYILWLHDEKIAKVSEYVLKLADEMDVEDRLDESMGYESFLWPRNVWDLIGDDD